LSREADVRTCLAILLAILVAGCGSEAASPAAGASATSGPANSVATSPSPIAETPDATETASPAASLDPIGDVECSGGATSGSNDYPAGIEGGVATVDEGMRALQGLLSSDQIVVVAERAAVVRDGRTIFVSWWSESSTGGWLLTTFVVCGDAGIQLTAPD
jgi:hypothetical protein